MNIMVLLFNAGNSSLRVAVLSHLHSIALNIFLFLSIYFYFIFISWRLITLQYCSVFLPHIDMNQPWIYMYSPSRSCLPPPSPPDPSGSSQGTRSEHLSHASNLGWWSVSPLIIYMFDAVLSRQPTLAFSHRVQKSLLYIRVSFSVLHVRFLLPFF